MDSSILAEGLSVNIKRTDGRIHSALVSGINMDNKSVTVEWFERGETKGKEVELTSVLALNPDVILPSQDRRLSKQDSSEESEEISSLSKRDINKNQSTATLNMRSPRPSTSRTSNSFTGRVPVPSHSLKTKPSTPDVGKSPSTPSVMRHSFQGSTPVTTSSNSRPGVPARRSNVVKEVERLKKNREERRMRQAEEKAEKEALMNQDPGNPNWELSNMIRDYQALLEYKPIKLSDSIEEHQIIVCVRKRPLNKKEIARREIDVISIPSKNTIIVHEPKNKVDLTKYLENQQFRFDFVFDESCKNDIVYKFSAQPLVKTIFEGGMATCFAYGQTGSGKTHTMGGVYGKNQSAEDGIYALVAKDVFAHLASPKFHNLVVSASFFEIYSGRVFDLLANKSKLRVLEDGKGQTQIIGLTEQIVDSCGDVLHLIKRGNAARTSGQTSANSNSSRSHAIFQILLRRQEHSDVYGKFSLIDLAGNERGADTSSSNRQTRMEGAEINKSLLALKECIRALGKKGTHLPFRVSKLTQVLRDSFIGENSRTCMIAMVSPGMNSCENTLNTLRYADRVKELGVTELETKIVNDDKVIESDMQYTDSDLERLRSLNERDMPADLYTFHEAVSQVQLAEDEVIDNHKSVIDFMEKVKIQATELYELTQNVDYDQDAYSAQWELLLSQQLTILEHAKNLVTEFRSKLSNEEKMSQRMQRH